MRTNEARGTPDRSGGPRTSRTKDHEIRKDHFLHRCADTLGATGDHSVPLLDVITIIHDAMTLGVRRVFAAMVPHKSDVPVQDAGGNSESLSLFTVDDFLHAASIDSAYLEYGRYFVDFGRRQSDDGTQGMFVVDLETGETALAFTYNDPPALEIWEKACASPSFREESEALFRKYETASVAFWQFFHTPKEFDALIGEVVGEIHSTPCN